MFHRSPEEPPGLAEAFESFLDALEAELVDQGKLWFEIIPQHERYDVRLGSSRGARIAFLTQSTGGLPTAFADQKTLERYARRHPEMATDDPWRMAQYLRMPEKEARRLDHPRD